MNNKYNVYISDMFLDTKQPRIIKINSLSIMFPPLLVFFCRVFADINYF